LATPDPGRLQAVATISTIIAEAFAATLRFLRKTVRGQAFRPS
jgi:hypothetical protein